MATPSPSPDPADEPADRQGRAYKAGARMARERIAREAPLDAEALAAVEAADVVVVSGTYDHVEQVLGALDMPFTSVTPAQFGHVELRREQLLVLNCPGDIGSANVARVRDFVTMGGSLFSTDWALERVVQRAFPDTIGRGGTDTRDDVVPIEILDHDNPFLRGVIDGADEPRWWLEASSYPIRVLDPGRVRVLLGSPELGRRYGESAVAVLFEWGEGEVFHMISHYYLQRTELRSRRQAQTGSAYFAEKGVPVAADLRDDLDELRVGEVESAATSSRLLANAVARKKRAAIDAERRRGAR
jgi:hypothetical protein